MSQYDFGTIVPSNKSGNALAVDLNAWRDALHSSHKSTTAPAYAIAGLLWLDDTTATAWALKLYDGADWISIGTFNPTTNVFSLSGAAAFTTLTASDAVTRSPANQPVVLSPTGTGVVTINPATAGSVNNVIVGGVTPLAGFFTTLSASGTMSGAVSYAGAGATGIFGTTSAGTISLRPQGVGSATNQTTINSSGNMTINGALTVTG